MSDCIHLLPPDRCTICMYRGAFVGRLLTLQCRTGLPAYSTQMQAREAGDHPWHCWLAKQGLHWHVREELEEVGQ